MEGYRKRLIPFPEASDPLSTLVRLPLSLTESKGLENPVANLAPDLVGKQAATIVSEAAAILDEEMAKGVLAARRPDATARYGPYDAGTPWLRQVHDLVDNFAAIWPMLQGVPPPEAGASQPAASGADGLAELRPWATVKPGQRATISMTVCNSESRSVRLVPLATDLLGSRGGRIAAGLLEFTPAEFRLEPQEQKELAIATTVPAEAVPGCYSGLLVVTGVDYLRALITIEVA